MLRAARDLAALTRPWLAGLAGLAVVAGAAAGGVAPLAVAPLATALGALVAALGASALNQVQERALDASMARTAGRPLAAGRMTSGAALGLAVALIGGGCAAVALAAGARALGLCVACLAVYHLLYTPLKRYSAFAVVPGALVGAALPALGWALGSLAPDGRLLLVVGFLFVWQLPHFWLKVLAWPADLPAARLPSPLARLGSAGLARVALAWAVAAAAAVLALPLLGLVPRLAGALLAALVTGGLLVVARRGVAGMTAPAARVLGWSWSLVAALALLLVSVGCGGGAR